MIEVRFVVCVVVDGFVWIGKRKGAIETMDRCTGAPTDRIVKK
jgi:hypothetical protein